MDSRKTITRPIAFAGPFILIALAIFPWLGPPVYFISLIFTVFLYVVLATSWNIIGGYAGYLSFGHAAFFGIGAYATAMMMKEKNSREKYSKGPNLSAILAR